MIDPDARHTHLSFSTPSRQPDIAARRQRGGQTRAGFDREMLIDRVVDWRGRAGDRVNRKCDGHFARPVKNECPKLGHTVR